MNCYTSKIFLLCLIVSIAVDANAAGAGGNRSKNTRIVGGQLATIDAVPYLMQFRAFGQFFCGGTLVTPTIVVSAAHCLKATEVKNMVVVGGATTITDPGVQRRIAAYKAHPKYDITRTGSTHDIVVFKLDAAMMGPNIDTVPLCSQEVPVNSKIQVSGWGITHDQGTEVSHQVRTVQVPTFSHEECKRRGGSDITESMLCAGDLGRRDICNGDSGGPAIYRRQLCGVVSWGRGCADDYHPGIYTNVMAVRKWIDDTMRELA